MDDQSARNELGKARDWLEQTGLLELPEAHAEMITDADRPALRLVFGSVYDGHYHVFPVEPEADCSWKVGILSQGAVSQYAPTATGAVRWVATSVLPGSDMIQINEASLVDSFKKDEHIYDAYRFGFRLVLVHRFESPGEISDGALLPFNDGQLIVFDASNKQYQPGKAWYAGPKRSFERLDEGAIEDLQKATDW